MARSPRERRMRCAAYQRGVLYQRLVNGTCAERAMARSYFAGTKTTFFVS